MELADVLLGAVLAALVMILMIVGASMLNGYYVGASSTIAKVTTLTAVVRGDNYWYMEVVWAGPVFQVKYIILSGGRLYPAGQAVIIKCGVGYYPAPYHYCIYQLPGNLPMPVGVLGS